MSRLRQDRKAQADYAAAVRALVDAGVAVIDRPGYRDGPVTVDHLDDGDGNALTDEGHAGCPGHAAVFSEHDPERVSFYCVDPPPTATPTAGRVPLPPQRCRRWRTER